MNRGLRQPRTPAASDETWGGWGWVRWVVGWVGGVLIDYGQLPTCAPSRAASGKTLLAPLPVPQVESAPADDENTDPAPAWSTAKSTTPALAHGETVRLTPQR